MKKILLLIMSLMMISMMAACSSDTKEEASVSEKAAVSKDNTAKTSNEEETKKAEEEKTLPETKEYSFMMIGEEKTITVPYEPKKIVVIGYDVLDIIDALGHKDIVVGVPDPANPMFPSFLEGYENVESIGSFFGNDFESIAGLQPDLIIAGARTASSYEGLSEIAPTAYFTIPGMNSTGFEEKLYSNIRDIAYLLNDEAAADKVIGDLKGKIADMKTTVDNIDNPSALFLIVTGKTVKLYTDNPESRYGFVYNEFGFDAMAAVDEIQKEDKKVNNGESSRHGNSVSFEFISAKNPNYIIVIDRGIITGETDIAASDILDNPLVGSTNAAKNGNIIYLDGESWYLATGGVKSTSIMIDNLKDGIGK